VFTAPTAFYFYLGAGVLAGTGASSSVAFGVSSVWRRAVLACGLAAAGFFAVTAYRLAAADLALAAVQRRLDANDLSGAAEAYRQALSRSGTGVTADLDLSRRWAAVAAHVSNPMSKIYYGQVAAGAASLATESPEQQQNAWYNLAILEASTNDARAVEYSLRAAIAAAPVWYKPHWALARLLEKEGRLPEAEPEARRALYLDGGKDAEVVSTVNEILSSTGPRP
jgi:tetratricopeptide (TPR) repeat protein